MIGADFPGAAFPPGTPVRFRTRTGWLTGAVTALRPRSAAVSGADGNEWSVPYPGLTAAGKRAPTARSLRATEALGRRLLRHHAGRGRLDSRWRFGFDLAPVRAGVTDHARREISVSIPYCLKASRAQVRDTILHEIAHAICGPRHRHDAEWRRVAASLGCSGDRCHTVEHTPAPWLGECGCGRTFRRHRLQRKLRSARCAACRAPIRWRRAPDLAI